jgi:hypothetical protein
MVQTRRFSALRQAKKVISTHFHSMPGKAAGSD